MSVHVVNTFLFSFGIKRDLLFLDVPNLLVGDVYHVKNDGCVLEVFIKRLFNRALSIYAQCRCPCSAGSLLVLFKAGM